MRDLGRRQAREGAQRERDRGLRCQRGVTAGEDEPQLVVGDRMHLVLRRRLERAGPRRRIERRIAREDRRLLREHLCAPRPVDRPVPGRGDDPRPGVRRDPVARPPLERRDVGVGDRLLGEVEVAEDPDERGDRAAVLLVEDAGDDVARIGQPISRIGRTSTRPVCAPGIRDAASIASSRLGTSMR